MTLDTTNVVFSQQGVTVYQYVFGNIIVPIAVALITYLLVDRLGEWRKRKKYSRLGMAIIESLQEEINHRIKIMKGTQEKLDNDYLIDKPPPNNQLPKGSWNGMSTIPDDVLLRIIETSADQKINGFPPKDCRIHCKNYFEHMCNNYNNAIPQANNLYRERRLENRFSTNAR